MAEVYDQEKTKHHLSGKSFAHWNKSFIFWSSTDLLKDPSISPMIKTWQCCLKGWDNEQLNGQTGVWPEMW